MRPLSPCILPVCFAAFAFANIYVFNYQKKKKKNNPSTTFSSLPNFLYLTCNFYSYAVGTTVINLRQLSSFMIDYLTCLKSLS